MKRLLVFVLLWSVAASAAEVKVVEGKRAILTGPFNLKGPSPQQRLNEFRKVDYAAVYIENEYLRCCVLPDVGGRLYEVINKATGTPVFFVNPYLETHPDDFEGGHPWNLGGVEVNFPYFHHGNTYNDRWQWAPVGLPGGAAGVALGFTSRPTMQRASFRVLLRPGVARVDLEYRFENLNPYPWGIAAWIDTMHPKTMDTQFILPTPWVAGHGHNSFRTNLEAWPVRNGVDLSWQKNVPAGTSLSEFAFMPRQHFHGCYDHALDRGAVRVFDPATLPAAKLWTQSPPVTPEQYYQHFEIWTATSAVMEDPGRQPELSCHAGADCWYQVWGIGGYVFANETAALNLRREADGSVIAGVCGTRKLPGCVASLLSGHDVFCREVFTLDPAKPWKKQLAAPPGDVVLDVTGPDGTSIARWELRTDELPQEQWQMPKEPRWKSGINAVYHEEDYSTLWRRRGHFFDGAVNGYRNLLKDNPDSAKLMIDLARAHLKDQQARVGYAYGQPGPKADEDAAKRREADLAAAVGLLRQALAKDSQNSRGHFYLGLALERQGNASEAAAEYRVALSCPAPDRAAAIYLARLLVKADPGEAVDLARLAAASFPQSRLAGHMLMAALIADGRRPDALAVGRKLYEADPSDALTAKLLSEAGGARLEAKLFGEKTQRLVAGDIKARNDLEADFAWLMGR